MKFYLCEDRSPKQLRVIFSSKIINEMELIENFNQNNVEGISQWYDYIEGIKRWLSNPSIAWDYANRFAKFPNGSRYIRDFNYNIGYTVKTNHYGAYVYVFIINLKPQEFGLKTIKENKSRYFKNTMKTNKKVVRLTESDLYSLIDEAVREVLRETDYKRYHQAAVAANNRMLRKYPDAYDIDWDDEWSEDKKDEIDSLNKKKMDYLELRDKDYQEKHPNITAHPYDTDSYIRNVPYIPQRFLYKYNQGKNTKIAERIPNENWSERTKGRGKKPMTQDEFEDYNNIKSELERLKR